jgi:hypothetical protein
LEFLYSRSHKRPRYKSCSLLSLWRQIRISQLYDAQYGLFERS